MTVDELQVLITANTKQLQKEMKNANKRIDSLQKTAKSTSSGVLSSFNKLKNGIIALGIGKVIADSIKTGMDAIESDNLFDTSLGKYADSVKSWSDNIADSLGLNATAMRKNVGVIYNMTTSMGLAEGNALKMSQGISLLTEDMASFYNLDSTEAFNKLRAGLTGETEPLKALGILVDENTIKQVAYQYGIASTGAELTQQQKVLARYVAILQQTGNAQGDLARTINSPSNQLRIFKNQVTQAGMSLGNVLLPMVSAVLPYLTAFAKVITLALNSLAKFLGISSGSGGLGGMSSGVSDLSNGLGGVSDNVGNVSSGLGGVNKGLNKAGKEAKKLKGQLAGFDEMTVLTEKTSDTDSSGATGGSGLGGNLGAGTLGAIGGIGADGLFNLGDYDSQADGVVSKVDEIVEKIKSAFASFSAGVDWGNLFNSLNTLQTALQPFTETIWSGLKWAWDNLLVPLAQWTIGDLLPAFLNAVAGALEFLTPIINDSIEVIKWLWENFLQPIAEWTAGAIVDTLNGLGDALEWIGEHEWVIALIEGLAISIGLVTGALKLWNIAVALWNSIGAICTAVTTGFSVAMGILTSPITLVIGAIALLVAGIILLIKNWDDVKATAIKVWDKIKETWQTVKDWFNKNVITPVKNFFTGMWNGLKTGASNAWSGIKSVFSKVTDWFKNIFTKAWQGVKNVFSTGGKIFDGIKEGIADTFKTVVNGIIGGINKVIAVPFNAINKLLNKIRNISVAGVEPFKDLIKKNPLSVPEIPLLARGGVVDSPTIAMVGEAGREAVMPLERNTGWIDELADKINSKGNNGQPVHVVVNIGEDTIVDKIIDGINDKNFMTNGEVFI